jgi:predicted DNA-binding protein
LRGFLTYHDFSDINHCMYSITVPDAVATQLHALSIRTGQSEAFFVTQALESYLEEMSDFFIGLQALRQTEGEKEWSLEDVLREFSAQ